MSQPPAETHFFKILIVGDSAIGTLHLFDHLTRGQTCFRCPTTGTRGTGFTFPYGGALLTVHLWAIGGDQRCRPSGNSSCSISSSYLMCGAHAAILHFDMCDRSTFQNLKDWVVALKASAGEGIMVGMVATKSDVRLSRAVGWEETTQLAMKEGLAFAADIPFLHPESSSASLGFWRLIDRLLRNARNGRDGAAEERTKKRRCSENYWLPFD